MDAFPYALISLVCGLVFGFVGQSMGYKYGKNPLVCFLLGFFLGLIGLLLILVVPAERETRASPRPMSQKPRVAPPPADPPEPDVTELASEAELAMLGIKPRRRR